MKYDIILAGVGGQGVLSLAAGIANAAIKEALQVRQSEVHGMAQRGGAVQAHLRMSDREIHGDLIGRGSASMILSMEPLEALRYLEYLSPDGVVISSRNPFLNIDHYPAREKIEEYYSELPHYRLIDSDALAKEAGSSRYTNMVMVGAASEYLPVKTESMEASISELFSQKGEDIIQGNIRAFRLGKSNE